MRTSGCEWMGSDGEFAVIADKRTRILAAAVVFATVCTLAAWFGGTGGAESQAVWYSIVPPLLAIVLAFLTHNVMASLGVAIIIGGLLSAVPQAPLSAQAWGQGTVAAASYPAKTLSDSTNLLILSFIPPIFTMVEIIIASGGFNGIVLWLLRRVRSRKSAQMATAALGVVCFIDDYANAIIVGSMMQPITDRYRVSRAKLAFLVDATSAPVSGLAVVSTWIAYEVGLFADVSNQLGIGKTGYAMFFDALSFRFYCLLMLMFMFTHILVGRDFGPMRKAEAEAQDGDEPPGGAASQTSPTPQAHGRALNALIPLAGLVTFHMTGLWLDGGGPSKLRDGGLLLSWDYWREVISAAEHSHFILMSAAVFGTALAILCGRLSGSLRLSTIPRCVHRGVKRALLPSVILVLAWSLKHCCQHLDTGTFLTALLAGHISPCWFAPLLFIVASLTSFATGTSWGTMAILIPTAIPVAFALDGNAYGPTTMISLGAVLDGAIFGDHCSPISDTTIISSVASSCDLIQHVRTQLPYSLVVAAIALVLAYVPSSFGLSPRWSLTVAALAIVGVLLLGSRWKKAATPGM
jgi:Na+/H+ antiporter NhaC